MEKIKKEIDLQKLAITQEVQQLKETQEGNAKELQLLNKASEDAEREKRKSNLIFFKLPEKANADIKGRAKDDLAAISKVCKEDLDIEPPKAVKTFRLGKFNKGKQDNARPIKVICQTEEESARVLKRLSEMRGEKNPKLESIFIVQDRPFEERQSYKKLRVELKRRQEAGEENLVIRKGKITERTEGRNQNMRERERENFIYFIQKFTNYLVEINKGETGTKISSIAGAPATPKKKNE